MKIYKYLYKILLLPSLKCICYNELCSEKENSVYMHFFPQNEIQELHMIVFSGRIVSKLIYIYLKNTL